MSPRLRPAREPSANAMHSRLKVSIHWFCFAEKWSLKNSNRLISTQPAELKTTCCNCLPRDTASGTAHVTDARLRQGDIDLRERLSPADRAQLKLADEQDREGRRLSDLGHFREALAPAERALAIRRKIEGDAHRDTARDLNELGSLYCKLKEYGKAEPLVEETLAIQLKLFGNEHPETALTLNNAGKLFDLTGDFAKAEPYYQRSLAIRVKVLGPRHLDTLASYESLGQLEEKLTRQRLANGDYSGAQRSQDALIHVLTARYGDRDWRVTNARLTRSDIDLEESLSPETRTQLKEADRREEDCRRLDAQGRTREALAQAEQTLDIRKRIQGGSHRATAKTLNFLGVLNVHLDEHAKAESLYLEAFDVSRKILGEFHPDTALCLKNLSDSYAAREEFDKAEPVCRKVAEIQLIIRGTGAGDGGGVGSIGRDSRDNREPPPRPVRVLRGRTNPKRNGAAARAAVRRTGLACHRHPVEAA